MTDSSPIPVSVPPSPTVEIIVRLKLPITHFEIALSLAEHHGYRNFDEFVSHSIKGDIEDILCLKEDIEREEPN